MYKKITVEKDSVLEYGGSGLIFECTSSDLSELENALKNTGNLFNLNVVLCDEVDSVKKSKY